MSSEFSLANRDHALEIRTSAGNCVELFAAMVAAQAGIGAAIADKTNTYHKSKYADLASVFDAIRPQFAEHGLGVMQFPFTRTGFITRSYRDESGKPVYQAVTHNEDDPESAHSEVTQVLETVPVIYVIIRTRLIHASGQWLEQDLEIPVAMGKNPAQSTGIAITYGKRYSLQAIAGVPSDDDDGQGLTDNNDAYSNHNNNPRPAAVRQNTTNRRPKGPARPQGAKGRLEIACDRLRQADNLNTLRYLYEADVKNFERDGGDGDLAELEKVKDEVKQRLAAAEKAAPVEAEPTETPAPVIAATKSFRNEAGGINF